MFNMRNSKTKRIIAGVIVVLVVIAMILPMLVSVVTL